MSKRREGAEDLGSNNKSGSAVSAGGVEFASEAPSFERSAEPEFTPVDPDGHDGDATVTIEDGQEVEASGRSGSMFKRDRVEADVDGDRKNRNAKPIKTKRPPKQRKAKAPVTAEEVSLPVNVAVDFFRGITKEREAESIARAFVEKHFDAPNASFVYVQKWRDGIAVEMQEGGGKAYLPEVLAMLDEDPNALCILPMTNRVMQVRLDGETGVLEALVLTAGQSPIEGSFLAMPTVNMSPFDRRGSKVFIVGVAAMAASLIALTFSLGAFFIDTKAWSLPYIQQTRVNDLPSVQTAKIKAALEQGDCIAKMEFTNGTWNIVTGWNDGNDLCTSVRRIETVVPEAAPVMPTDGAAGPIPAPGAGPGMGAASGPPMPMPQP